MASRPEFFRLLFLLLPVIIVMILRYVTGRKDLADVAGRWRTERFFDLYTVKFFFSSFGLLIFYVSMVMALAGFPGRETPVSWEPAGTDIIFVIDVSESMRARDVPPSRLTAASRIVESVCENTPGGRFGVVVFKGSGVRMVPSTEDVEAVYNFLSYLSPDLLTSPGSNIRSGIETAIKAFPEAEERKKYIILMTDGEIHDGELIGAAEDAVRTDVEIYCIGMGTGEGARIPVSDGGYLTNSSGETVITKLHEEELKALAESTGGKYYLSQDSGLLPELFGIATGTVSESDSRYRIVVKERYRFFLVIALVGLFIYKAVRVVKWRKEF